MKKLVIAAITVVALSAFPSHAANVTVNLELRAGHHSTATMTRCAVIVPAGSNGIAVLARATITGCISEYSTEERPPYGTFVWSIDGIRGAKEALDATYWSLTLNGAYADVGVDDYQAKQGDRVGFTYTTWVHCLVAPTCV